MSAEIIEKNGKQFLKVELMPVNQKDKQFFIANIKAKYILEIFTVEPAEYDVEKHSALANDFKDDKSYYDYLINDDKKRIDDKSFQRKENTNRVKEISDFINNEEYALFPNTIIVTCDLANDDLDFDEDLFKNKSNLSIIQKTNKNYYLYIPYQKNSVLIIDGQHRLKGLQNAQKEITDNYEVLISFIIGFERMVLAKLFYTINYTQKSVNKSLLYHLSGEFSKELDEITFLHEIVKILNELDYSPFYGRIKMLGVVPDNIDDQLKDKMSISQAFLIDYLLDLISVKSSNSLHQPIFLECFKNSKQHILMVRFLINYFLAIKELRSDWDKPQESIISKSVGVGALVKLVSILFLKILFDEYKGDYYKVLNLKIKEIKPYLKGIEKVNLSSNSEFKSASSAGSLNKLKEAIIISLDYLNVKNYESFIDSFKKDYVLKFRNHKVHI